MEERMDTLKVTLKEQYDLAPQTHRPDVGARQGWVQVLTLC